MSKMRSQIVFLFFLTAFIVEGCRPMKDGFNYGLTNSKALNKYVLIEENNFGAKRLQYSQNYFHNTTFDIHLKEHGDPEMVYEYPIEKKYQGIKLFYMKLDSVYIFESKKSNCNCISLMKTEKISQLERTVYNQLSESKR